MNALLLVGLLASASAAPQWSQYYPAPSPSNGTSAAPQWPQNYKAPSPPFDGRWISEQTFNTNQSMQPAEGIAGNEYRITMPLSGFEQKDITVSATKGSLTIQAVHIDANETNSETRRISQVYSLPMNVGVQGRWSYKNGVVNIVLPLEKHNYMGYPYNNNYSYMGNYNY